MLVYVQHMMSKRFTLWVNLFLKEAHTLWQIQVVSTFLKAGVPLVKFNQLKGLLEELACE